MQKEKPLNPADYEEEAKPFDDVMRQLLKAKPQHKEAEKPKKAIRGKKKKT
jgi:hypothetical protein